MLRWRLGPSCERCNRLLLREVLGLLLNTSRNPRGERYLVFDMLARRRVLFSKLGDLAGSEVARGTNQVWPQSSMNQRHFAADEPADQYLPGVSNGIQESEYSMTLRMSPPATLDHLPNDCFGQARGISFGRDEDDAMLLNEGQCILDVHKRGVHDA